MPTFKSRTEFEIIPPPLGEGAFGRALLGTCQLAKYVLKEVNLTKLRAMFSHNPAACNKLLQEARSEHEKMKGFDHPNIVRVFGSFEETRPGSYYGDPATYYYLVMEYCEGGDLSKAIENARTANSPFSEAQILDWGQQLASAVQYIHVRNSIHRDIKSKNVLLKADKTTLKLGDFGLAKCVEGSAPEANSIAGIAGTVSYMSPEMVQNKPISKKTDIWSLGVVLFEIANLKVPFPGNSFIVVGDAIRGNPPAPFATRYSSELRLFVLAMLEKDETKRPDIRQVIANPFLHRAGNSNLGTGDGPARNRDPSSNDKPANRGRDYSSGKYASKYGGGEYFIYSRSGVGPASSKKQGSSAVEKQPPAADSASPQVYRPGPSIASSVVSGAIPSLPLSAYQEIRETTAIPSDFLKSAIIQRLQANYVTPDQLAKFGDDSVKKMFQEIGLYEAVMSWRASLAQKKFEKTLQEVLSYAETLHFFAKEGQLTQMKESLRIMREKLPSGITFDVRLRTALIEHRDSSDYENTILMQAAENNHADIVQYLVREFDANLTAQDNLGGGTAIHLAAAQGHLEMVTCLLKIKPDLLELKNDINDTCLNRAAIMGKLNVVRFLVTEKKANMENRGQNGRTPLVHAAARGNLTVVEFLAQNGADLSARSAADDVSSMAVHLAAELGHLDVVKFIIQRQSDMVNATNANGDNALVRAAMGNQVEVMRYFVEELGVAIETRGYNGRTPLLAAAIRGHLDAIKYAHQQGAKLDTKSGAADFESNALQLAANFGHLEVVKYLLQQKPDLLESRNGNGETAVNRAAQGEGALEVVRYLIEEKGASFEVRGTRGRTPLIVAAVGGLLDCVQYLVRRGANIMAKDSSADEDTAIHLAAYGGQEEVVSFLLDQRPGLLELRTKTGHTPLSYARNQNKSNVVQLLTSRGARQ